MCVGILRRLLLVLFLLSLLPTGTQADNYQISEQELTTIEHELKTQRQQLAALRISLRTAAETSTDLRQSLNAAKSELRKSERTIEELSRRLSAASATSTTLRTRSARLQAEVTNLKSQLSKLNQLFEEFATDAERAVRRANLRGGLGAAAALVVGFGAGVLITR